MIVNTLIQPIEARLIRIYPESWHGHMSMRMELYGCEIHSGKKKKLSEVLPDIKRTYIAVDRITLFDYFLTNAN